MDRSKEVPFKITIENLKYWQALSNIRNDLRKVERKIDKLQYSVDSVRGYVFNEINEMIKAMQVKVECENIMIAEIEKLKHDVALLKNKKEY